MSDNINQPEQGVDGTRVEQASGKKGSKGGFKLIIGLIIIALILVMLFLKFISPKKTQEKPADNPAQSSGKVDTSHDFTLAPLPKPVVAQPQGNNPPADNAPQGGFIGGGVQKSGFSRSLGGVMITSNHSESARAQSNPNGQGNAMPPNFNAGNVPSGANTAALASNTAGQSEQQTGQIGASSGDIYGGETFKAGTVNKSKFDPNLLLEKGTYIPCVMRHAFNSNVDGQISCVVADDVYSSAGTVKLVEKGSRVNGVYRGGNVNAGSQQMFVIWQEIRTPNNLVVNVYSGSSDELGNAGLNGYVDYHWGIKLGMAALVSIVNVTGQNLSTQLGKNLGGNSGNSTSTEDTSNVAVEILRQYANVKPTLYKNQGDKVGIFVSRDIDFSSVYNLRARSYDN